MVTRALQVRAVCFGALYGMRYRYSDSCGTNARVSSRACYVSVRTFRMVAI